MRSEPAKARVSSSRPAIILQLFLVFRKSLHALHSGHDLDVDHDDQVMPPEILPSSGPHTAKLLLKRQ